MADLVEDRDRDLLTNEFDPTSGYHALVVEPLRPWTPAPGAGDDALPEEMDHPDLVDRISIVPALELAHFSHRAGVKTADLIRFRPVEAEFPQHVRGGTILDDERLLFKEFDDARGKRREHLVDQSIESLTVGGTQSSSPPITDEISDSV